MLMLTDRVDDELLDAAGPQLRVVADYSVGVDNVDLEACRRRGVAVTNTPGVLTRATAELTIALILSLLRRVTEGDRLIRRGEDWIWAPNLMLGRGLDGLDARARRPWTDRQGGRDARPCPRHGRRVLHSRAAGSRSTTCSPPADVVSLHLPLTDESRHLIDAAALARMKPGAVLVNTSRGPIVDEDALVDRAARGQSRRRGARRLRARAGGPPRPARARQRRPRPPPRLGDAGDARGDGDALRRGAAGGAARRPRAGERGLGTGRAAVAPRARLLELRARRGTASPRRPGGRSAATPIGRPSSLQCSGSDTAGWPVTFAIWVKAVKRPARRNDSHGSSTITAPIRPGGWASVGVSTTS